MMTLIALLAVTTGAWAESKPIGLNVEYAAGDVITSTTDVYVYYGEQPGSSKQMVVKITSTQPLKILMITGHSFDLYSDAEVYYMPSGESTGGYAGGIPCLGESTGDKTVVHVASGTGTLTDPYVFGSGPSGTTVPLTWDATAQTATLTNGMPAGNVTVSVEYFPQATMDDGAVTAAEGVKATTEDALVTIDKSKLTGVAKLMYFVSTDAEATAPAYTAEGWTDVLPTAANYTEAGNVNVWYYAVGADSEDPDKTYSDGDICAKALTVTLGAAPLWNAEFDLTDAPEADKTGKWSTNIPEGGVKKGTEVTVTYTGTKKIIGVKAEKKAAPKLLEFEPLGVKFYYYEGETWGEAIRNHPENAANGWSIDEEDNNVKNNGRVLHENDHDDEIKPDTPVDPNIGYIW